MTWVKDDSLDERLLRLLLENSLEGVALIDRRGVVRQINQAMCTMTGMTPDFVEGKCVSRLIKSKTAADFFDPIRESLWQDGFWQGNVEQDLVSDHVLRGFMKVSAVLPLHGPVRFYLCQLAEIRQLGQDVTAASMAAGSQDPLTQLATLPVFKDRLRQAVANAARHERSVGVMMLDLDRFGVINDSLGRAFGDELLCIVARRLTGCLRDSDSVARIGADEFGLLLSDIDEGPGAIRNSGFVAQKIYEALSKPVMLGNKMIEITAGLGITLFPQDGRKAGDLLKNAEAALSHARRQSRNNYEFFSHKMAEAARHRFALESSLRQAVDRQELCLYYQPQVELSTGRVIGAEALIRWIHPEQGVISPGEFIPVAEETGLILPIGEWVIRTACQQIATWRDKGLPPVRVGVNLSAVQFKRQDLEGIVRTALAETRIDPSCLDLEITESAIMDDVEKAVKMLDHISKMGVKLSIDDFGTGYSSLSQLRHFPFKTLKIDRSFILSITEDKGDRAIVNAIIAMAHSLNQTVIVEGVETEGQLGIMRDLQCNEMQGFLFSAPVPVEKLTEMLEKGQRMSKNGRRVSDHDVSESG